MYGSSSDGLHALLVGDEVRRDVALVELHALDELELDAERVGLLDRDDAVLADLVHAPRRSSSPIAGSAAEIDATCAISSLASTSLACFSIDFDDGLDGLLDAALQRHRVGAGGDVLHAALDHGPREDRRGGGAVTGDVVRLGGDLLAELGAHVLPRVLELDLLGDRHAVVRDGGRAPLLVEHHVPALGAERDRDRVGELVDAGLERAPRLLTEPEQLAAMVPPSGEMERGPALSRARAPAPKPGGYLPTMARTSRADRIRYSSPWTLTSVPPYFE